MHRGLALRLAVTSLIPLSLSCSLLAGQQLAGPAGSTAIPPKTGVPPSTTGPGLVSQAWRITPFRVGDSDVPNPPPGWRYLTIYFAIENAGDSLDYYLATGRPPSWLRSGLSSDYPLSQPAIATSSITTAEGYSYEPTKIYGSMPLIHGDEAHFYLSDSVVAQWGDNFAPNYDAMPAVPPGFKFFGSVSFQVAANTTGYTWVIPGFGKFDLSGLQGDAALPYESRPAYIKEVGEPFTLPDGNTITIMNFARNLDGTSWLNLLFENPTGLDFTLADVQLHFFDVEGWGVPQYDYFACRPSPVGPCPNPPPQAVGPGQQLNYTVPLVFPAEMGDVYLQITYKEKLTSNGAFSTQAWAIYELRRDQAMTAAVAAATAIAQADSLFRDQLVEAAKAFVGAVLADSDAATRSYFNSEYSQPEGPPQQFRDARWGDGELHSPLDIRNLKGCFLLIPLEKVNWHADPASWDVWISDGGTDSYTFRAADGSQQVVAFYLRGSPGAFYLNSVFVSGCNAPPAPPEGWSDLGLTGEPISDIASAQGLIFAATNGSRHGVFRSDDLGRTWRAVNNGLFDFDIQQVEISPSNPDLVYAVDDGLWRSEDGGNSWKIAEYGQTCGNARSAALASDDGREIIWSNCATHSISHDAGRTWQEFGTGDGDRLISSPSDREVVYEIHNDFFSEYFPTVERLVIGEDDVPLAGVGPGMGVNDLAVSYADSSLVFLGTPNGLYRSRDGGGSWEPINQTLPAQGKDLVCTSVQTSPWREQEVYAACNGLVFHSTDLGSSWEALEAPQDVRLIHLLDKPKVLLAATQQFGLWSLLIE
jgi:photosystem II stability/assembly factor-like uncharacterized protein